MDLLRARFRSDLNRAEFDLFLVIAGQVARSIAGSVDKEQVTVDVEDGTLTLKGEKAAENQVEEGKYHRRERFYGRFQRSFRLPTDVNLDKIKAQFKDGVLRIEVPKPESQKPKQITVH